MQSHVKWNIKFSMERVVRLKYRTLIRICLKVSDNISGYVVALIYSKKVWKIFFVFHFNYMLYWFRKLIHKIMEYINIDLFPLCHLRSLIVLTIIFWREILNWCFLKLTIKFLPLTSSSHAWVDATLTAIDVPFIY